MNSYESSNHGFDLITSNGKIEKNIYAKDGIAKFIKTKTKNKLIFRSCANFTNVLDQPWDLFILMFNDNKSLRSKLEKQFVNLIPLYAIFDDSYCIISRLVGRQIYELVNKCTPSDISSLYIKEMGAILKTRNSHFKPNYDYRGIHYPKLQEVIVQDSQHILPNNHGWLSINTYLCLKFLLNELTSKQKNIIIVELGSWLGLSTCVILKEIKSGVLYCFDHFQNIALTDYEFNKPHPLDKFWMTVPRYETFCRNISPYLSKDKQVYTVKYDVRKSISVMKYNFITPHMVFIDAIKSRDALVNFLQNLFIFAPKTVVLGDDYIFQSVRDAVSKFMRGKNNYYLFTTNDCYILGQNTVMHNYGFITQDILNNKATKYIEQCIANNPMLGVIDNLYKHKYTEVCQMLKNDKIDINKPIDEFNNNTFYTLVIIEIYSQGKNNADVVRKYILNHIDSHPKKIKNALFLTWQNYINDKIIF